MKDVQKLMWSLGDYREIARKAEPTAVAMVEACGAEPGMQVLDVAAGTGNVAVAAARRGARVVAAARRGARVVALKGGQDPEPLVTRAMLQLSLDVAVVVHHRRRRWRPGRLVQGHRGRLVPGRCPSLTGRIGWQGHGPSRHRVRQPATSSSP
jgi:hypothetical protein